MDTNQFLKNVGFSIPTEFKFNSSAYNNDVVANEIFALTTSSGSFRAMVGDISTAGLSGITVTVTELGFSSLPGAFFLVLSW